MIKELAEEYEGHFECQGEKLRNTKLFLYKSKENLKMTVNNILNKIYW